MHRSQRRLMERLGRWPRLAAAGLCLLLALAMAVRAPGAATPEHTTRVVIATRTLPAGHVLRARDLAVARWPARLRPAGAAAAVDHLVGARLAGPLGAREPVTPSRLLGVDLTEGLAPGMVATTVSLSDPGAADLVHAGDQVDLLATPRPDLEVPDATGPGPPLGVFVVARRTRVLAVLAASADREAEVVLAVDRATAVRITRDRTTQMFTVVAGSP
jgi:Flp pilus assembly protein CpaB